jgi:hypothetical protein
MITFTAIIEDTLIHAEHDDARRMYVGRICDMHSRVEIEFEFTWDEMAQFMAIQLDGDPTAHTKGPAFESLKAKIALWPMEVSVLP